MTTGLFRRGGGIRPAFRQGYEKASQCGVLHQRELVALTPVEAYQLLSLDSSLRE